MLTPKRHAYMVHAGTLAGALPARNELGLTDLQRSRATQQSSRRQLLTSQVLAELSLRTAAAEVTNAHSLCLLFTGPTAGGYHR